MGISVWHGNGCNFLKEKVELRDGYERCANDHLIIDCIMLFNCNAADFAQ